MRQSKSVRLLNAQDIKRNLERMAREIVLQNRAFDALGFIGIRTRGLFWPSDWVRSSRSLMAKTCLEKWTSVSTEMISTPSCPMARLITPNSFRHQQQKNNLVR